MRFCLQSGESTREKTAIYTGARKLGYEVTSVEHCPPGCIPIGTVEFCEAVAPEQPKIKDFYPEFLASRLLRSVFLASVFSASATVCTPRFFKPATKWKSEFESRVVAAGESVPEDYYWLSEIVEFAQEWRYYVACGTVICSGWYAGLDEDEPAPVLDVQWPSDYSGAVDFGRLLDGRIALVEAHAPFACGWYGEDPREYTYWQAEAWNQWVGQSTTE